MAKDTAQNRDRIRKKHHFKVIRTINHDESVKFIEGLTYAFQNKLRDILHSTVNDFKQACEEACQIECHEVLFDKLIDIKGVTYFMASEISNHFGDFATLAKVLKTIKSPENELFFYNLTNIQTNERFKKIPKRTSIRIYQVLFKQATNNYS